MFIILLFVFIFIPIIEISLIVEVGNWLGLFPTLSLIFLTAIVGAVLVRNQGLKTIVSVQKNLQQGILPAQQVAAGVLLGCAGLLLLIPGFLTDLIGLLLLVPYLRNQIAQWALTKITVSGAAANNRDDKNAGRTIEGEFERKSDNDWKHLD